MKYFCRIGDVEREFSFERRGDELLAHCGDWTYAIDLSMVGDGMAMSMLVDGRSHDLILERVHGETVVQCRGERIAVEVMDQRERAANEVAGVRSGGPQEVCAAMPGVVVEVMVGEGDRVEAGQTLLILEAMKMQNPMQADADGIVSRVLVSQGDAVAGGALLLEIDGEAGE